MGPPSYVRQSLTETSLCGAYLYFYVQGMKVTVRLQSYRYTYTDTAGTRSNTKLRSVACFIKQNEVPGGKKSIIFSCWFRHSGLVRCRILCESFRPSASRFTCSISPTTQRLWPDDSTDISDTASRRIWTSHHACLKLDDQHGLKVRNKKPVRIVKNLLRR
jgi:hypothetical protein